MNRRIPVRAQLEKRIRRHKTRADLQEKFEGLVKLSRSLSDKPQRYVRENMTEEERVIFDILTRPGPESSAAARDAGKTVSRELLAKLKPLLVVDWRQKSSARSQVKVVRK